MNYLAVCGLALAGVSLRGAQPSSLMADHNRAWQLTGQLRADDAIPLLKEIIARDKTFYRAYATLAKAYTIKKAVAEGEAYFRSQLARDSRNPFAYFGLGELYFGQQNQRMYEAASDAYAKCLATDSEAFPCYSNFLILRKDPADLKVLRPPSAGATPARWLGLAQRYEHERKILESIGAAQKGIALARQRGDSDVVLRFEVLLSADHAALGNAQEMLQHAEEALRISEALGDWEEEFKRRFDLGNRYNSAGNFERSVVFITETITRARRIGNGLVETMELWSLAYIHQLHGARDQALELYGQSERQFENFGGPVLALNIVIARAKLQFEAGDFSTAMAFYEKCRRVASEHEAPWFEAFAIKGLANCHRELGDYFKALDLQAQAIRMFEQIGRRDNVGATTRDAGAVYAAMGAYSEARRRYMFALQAARETLDVEAQQRDLLDLEELEVREQRPAEALRHFNNELSLGKRNDYAPLRCRALLYAGSANLMLGKSQLALDNWEGALQIAKALHLQAEEAAALAALGRAHLKMGDWTAARAQFSASLELAERIGLARVIPEARRGLGETRRRVGDYAGALRELQLGIDALESQRTHIPLPELRAGFLQENWGLYEEIVMVLSELGKRAPSGGYDRMAFEYAERARARSFLDLLAEAKAQVTKGLATEQLARQSELFAKLSQASSALLKQPSPGNRVAVEKAEQNLSEWTLELRRTSPAYQQLRYPEPYHSGEAQQTAGRVRGVLLGYFLGEERSFVWAVGERTFQMACLPGRAEIEYKVRVLRAMISRRPTGEQSLEEYRKVARALYRMLIGPVSGGLARGQALIVIPAGLLHYLPFEALVTPSGRYLIEDHAVSYAPSGSVLGHLVETGSPAPRPYDLLAYGDPLFGAIPTSSGPAELVRGVYRSAGIVFPPLPNTRREVETISRTVPPARRRVRLGREATEASLKHETLRAYRMLHFATHAVLDEQSPALSGVVFSLVNTGQEDGILRVNEILNLELNADLVVLSACQTGLGKLVRGEGMIGLTRAFLYAGARRVIVSLWEVSDEATADFMGLFYRKMQGGANAGSALRQAKLAMSRSDIVAYRHPYFWAPFVAVGEP